MDFDAKRFDLAIMRTEHEAPGTRTEPILEEELVTVVAPELLDRQGDEADILSLPLLQQSTRPALWLDWFRATGLDPRRARPGARFEHFDMVIAAASGGLGVGIVPEILAREAIERGRLRLLTPQRVPTGEVYSLILPERRERDEVASFCDWLRREIADSLSMRS